MRPIQYKFQPKFIPTATIHNKCIVAELFKWDKGYGINFLIEVDLPLEGKIIGTRTKVIEQYEYYDYDQNVDYEILILFNPLFKGEIRGEYAEKIVWTIFYKLCKNEDWLKNNFPDYKVS